MTSINFKKQLPLNLISNGVYFGLNVLIGIWLVPFFIKYLGAAGYGLVVIATAITAHVSLITISLNSTVARFLAIYIQRKEFDKANRIFNTAFWSFGMASLGFILLFALFSYFSPRIFLVPLYLEPSVRWLFFLVLLSFIIAVFSSTLNAPLFAKNRLDLKNCVDGSQILLRTFFIFVFFLFFKADLCYVGWAYLVGALSSFILSRHLLKTISPEIQISRSYFDRSQLKDIFNMGGWLVVDQIGTVLLFQVDVILCNLLFGATLAGYYGALIQWSILLHAMAGVVGSTLLPMVVISHALGHKEKVCKLTKIAVKYVGLGLALPIGLIVGFASPLLSIWLNSDFVQYANLLRLMTFHLIINLAFLPLFGINVALNRMKWPGLVTIITGGINVLLALFLVRSGWGMYGIAAACAFVLTLKNVTFTPLYAAYILKLPFATFFYSLFWGVLAMVLLAGFSYSATVALQLSSIGGLLVCGSVLTLLYVVFGWIFILKKEEKVILIDFINSKRKVDEVCGSG